MENFIYCVVLLYPRIKTIVMIMIIIISFDSKGKLKLNRKGEQIFHSRKDDTHVIIGTTDCRDVSKDITFRLLIFT